jgi:transposase-like protein
MTSKKEIITEKPKARRPRQSSVNHSAAEKAQAVLAVWTERVKPAEVMRAMSISYITLQQWQERAMEGMLQALESRANLADGAALSPRLRTLLQKRQLLAGREKLTTRLEQLQEVAPTGPADSNA